MDINSVAILDEAKKILIDLVRINTTNPPGNELPAAEYLYEILKKENIDVELIKSDTNRGNIIARLDGNKKNKPLLLLSHLDVVPVEEDKWRYPPFEGKEVDNFIWGRGTLDCKNLVTQELLVLLLLKRQGVKLSRDVIFAATSDEEKGGTYGIKYLVDNYPDKISAECAINEGGGEEIRFGNKTFYLVSVAEKGICWLRIKVKGTSGHASRPIKNNAIVHIADVVKQIAEYKPPIKLTPPVEILINQLLKEIKLHPTFAKIAKRLITTGFANIVLNRVTKKNEALGSMIKAILTTTFTPTIISGGYKTNIIPSEATCEVDCRILPGEEPKEVVDRLRKIITKDVEITLIDEFLPSESPPETTLFTTIQNVINKYDSGAEVLPVMLTGATDSRYLRMKNIICYGFAPFKMDLPFDEYMKMVHGHNERISLNNLIFGIKVLYDIVYNFCS